MTIISGPKSAFESAKENLKLWLPKAEELLELTLKNQVEFRETLAERIQTAKEDAVALGWMDEDKVHWIS